MYMVLELIMMMQRGSNSNSHFSRFCRWECLLHQGRRIVVVGDLNIAPSAIDRCDAGPDFETNEFRRWFRSLLEENGGKFVDVFRAKHPDRTGAYTCWSTSSGAEFFNFGSRIDHILFAGSCLHEGSNQEDHSFINCHVEECDIMVQFKRWKLGDTPSYKWKGGNGIKLEGSDHAPVSMSLTEIPNVPQHGTPELSTRYCPQVFGHQQTIVSLLRNPPTETVKNSRDPVSFSGIGEETSRGAKLNLKSNLANAKTSPQARKKAKQSKGFQLSVKSYFHKVSSMNDSIEKSCDEVNLSQENFTPSACFSDGPPVNFDEDSNSQDGKSNASTFTEVGSECTNSPASEKEKCNNATMEWQRIQQFMQNSIPLCKGHKEQCVTRVVKKAGPNLGRRFYVCARAEGPASNPEANCGYFKWAASKSKQ